MEKACVFVLVKNTMSTKKTRNTLKFNSEKSLLVRIRNYVAGHYQRNLNVERLKSPKYCPRNLIHAV